ncbi:MAG: hypothetical protein AAF587_19910 [Bacteroidota bacterium]
MISVEKQLHSRSFPGNTKSSIGFVVYPKETLDAGWEEEMHIELSTVYPEASTVRMVDESGRLLIQEEHHFDTDPGRLVYTVRNLDAGTYFFEISDGFFYQVKELRIPPAS